jgi:hypothetical protein
MRAAFNAGAQQTAPARSAGVPDTGVPMGARSLGTTNILTLQFGGDRLPPRMAGAFVGGMGPAMASRDAEVPVAPTAAAFRTLADRWRIESEQIGPTSDLALLLMLPSYQKIIALGTSAVPHILAELQARPHHWWWALEMITGENPVPPESMGKSRAVREAWLGWGRARGYLA